MRMKRLTNHKHTIHACYLAYITQAIVCNFAPLLFLVLSRDFGINLGELTMLTVTNFFLQLIVDISSAKFLDKIGYRKAVVAAHAFAATGLLGLAFLPDIINPYCGILISVALYAIGGGLLEVVVSPLVEACPTDGKSGNMSLLHSFFCWGQVGVVLLSTLFFKIFGIDNWKILSCIWALLPFANMIFFLFVPIYSVNGEHELMSVKEMFGKKIFWVLMLIMVCSGASELAMSQWASYFAEKGLGISKTLGDLVGPCAFGVFMGISRTIYGKYSKRLSLKNMMLVSSVLCIMCYLTAIFAKNPIISLLGCAFCGFSVGLFWPGAISIAAGSMQGAGGAMYSLLACGGDVGCTLGPAMVGAVAGANGGNLKAGLLPAIIFPCIIFFGILFLKRLKR